VRSAILLNESARGAKTDVVVARRVRPAGVVAVIHPQVVGRVVPAAAAYAGSNSAYPLI